MGRTPGLVAADVWARVRPRGEGAASAPQRVFPLASPGARRARLSDLLVTPPHGGERHAVLCFRAPHRLPQPLRCARVDHQPPRRRPGRSDAAARSPRAPAAERPDNPLRRGLVSQALPGASRYRLPARPMPCDEHAVVALVDVELGQRVDVVTHVRSVRAEQIMRLVRRAIRTARQGD